MIWDWIAPRKFPYCTIDRISLILSSNWKFHIWNSYVNAFEYLLSVFKISSFVKTQSGETQIMSFGNKTKQVFIKWTVKSLDLDESFFKHF